MTYTVSTTRTPTGWAARILAGSASYPAGSAPTEAAATQDAHQLAYLLFASDEALLTDEIMMREGSGPLLARRVARECLDGARPWGVVRR